MERIWAVLDSGVITNTFVGDDDFADLVMAEHDAVVEITDVDPSPGIGWTQDDGGQFRPPAPYPSWVWDQGAWTAPLPRPQGPGWVWNEPGQEWENPTQSAVE